MISWCARVGRRHGRLSTTSSCGEENQESLCKWKQRRLETKYWIQLGYKQVGALPSSKSIGRKINTLQRTQFETNKFQRPVTAVKSLNDSIQPSLTTLSLMMSCPHIKFGCKRSCGLEVTIWTKLWCTDWQTEGLTEKVIMTPPPCENSWVVEHQTHDQKVVGSILGRSGGKIVFFRPNFLCWLLFQYPFHPVLLQIPDILPKV